MKCSQIKIALTVTLEYYHSCYNNLFVITTNLRYFLSRNQDGLYFVEETINFRSYIIHINFDVVNSKIANAMSKLLSDFLNFV